MPKLELTDRGIRAAKVPQGAKKLDLFDTLARGLTVRLSASGSRTFYLVYSGQDDKRIWHRLGEYPVPLSLAVAREQARQLRGQIQAGKDPQAEKRAQEASLTVFDLVESYLKKAVASRRSVDEIARRLRKNVTGKDSDGKPLAGASTGAIGDVRLAELHRRDFTKCLDAVVDRGATTEANRVFEDARALIRWARGRGDVDQNLMEGMRKPSETSPRDRWLTEAEISIMWKALEDADMRESTRRILRLCLITGQRVGEIAGITKSELSADVTLWKIPAERSKNGQPHTVPLSDFAIAIILAQFQDVEDLARKKARNIPEHLFPSPGFNGAVTPGSIPKALKRLEKNGLVLGVPTWTPHDLRRTAATAMESLGVSPHVIGHVLNHLTTTRAGITSSTYARYSYDREKMDALKIWAERLEAITRGRGAIVVPLRQPK
ncbi:tyrosine-type recombinase/integrase [Ochrobactrum sp. MYb379]|uniref:tyrosine-type recombinase/integrase n=1 Tax=Ochrobactrum sp. MYb379 TaxID=2745275 RepID=UPI0030B2AC5F